MLTVIIVDTHSLSWQEWSYSVSILFRNHCNAITLILLTTDVPVSWALAFVLTVIGISYCFVFGTTWYLVLSGILHVLVYRISYWLVSRTCWLPGISYVLIYCTSLYLVLLGKSCFLMCTTASYLVLASISYFSVYRASWYLVLPGISHCLVFRMYVISWYCYQRYSYPSSCS